MYQKLIELLITLLNDNRKSCQHFLNEVDSFLFQKCAEKCIYSTKLMRTAFISTEYLKNSSDLNGENVTYLFIVGAVDAKAQKYHWPESDYPEFAH